MLKALNDDLFVFLLKVEFAVSLNDLVLYIEHSKQYGATFLMLRECETPQAALSIPCIIYFSCCPPAEEFWREIVS